MLCIGTISCIYVTWWLVTTLPAKCWNPNLYSTPDTNYRCQHFCLTLLFGHSDYKIYFNSNTCLGLHVSHQMCIQIKETHQCKRIAQFYGSEMSRLHAYHRKNLFDFKN